jgi:hypothetical protein
VSDLTLLLNLAQQQCIHACEQAAIAHALYQKRGVIAVMA